MMGRKWRCALIAGAMFLAAGGMSAAERQLKVESSREYKTPDGRRILVENLGLPLTPNSGQVEFVSVAPDGERIAWAVCSGTMEHYIVGYGEKNGLRLIDVSRFFGPHKYKPTIAPYGDYVYILAGNRGPHLLKHQLSTGKTTEIHHFPARYYWLGHAVDSQGRIFWGVYDAPNHREIVIGVDPRTDKIITTEKISDDPLQSYALSPAIDDQDILYVPVGMNRPDLWMLDLKSGAKKSILTEEERTEFYRQRIRIPRVFLEKGKVYVALGRKSFLCTPEGLRPAPEVKPVGSWSANACFPSRQFRDDGSMAEEITSEGLVLRRPDGTTELIRVEGIPVLGHELFSIGSVYKGRLFGSGIFRGNLFSVDLKTLKAIDYGLIGRSGVQQYDLAATPYGVLFCGYTGGFFDLFDPDQPLEKGKNPKPVGSLTPYDQERPFRLTAANDEQTLFYVGSMATKNALPGALTRIDLKTGEFTCWKNIIPNQSIMDVVTVPGSPLIFGTSMVEGGTGSRPTEKEAQIFLFDPASGRVVWQDNPVKGACYAYQASMNTADGRILVIARVRGEDYRWVIFDPVTRTSKIGELCKNGEGRSRFAFSEKRPVKGRNYFTCFGTFYEFDPATNRVTALFSDPSLNETNYFKYVDEDDSIYYLDEARLMRWRFIR